MIKFRQLILPGDSGRDVVAVKIGLHRIGFKYFNKTTHANRAGAEFEAAIRAIQHNHKLHVDGIYGTRTHAVVSKHFNKYAVWLYRHAAIRHRSEYVNPFAHCQTLIVGRIDMGVDYHGYGVINGFGDMAIVGLGGGGWPGGHYINTRLTSGRHAGKYYYIAEAVEPLVRVGQHIKAGQALCRFAPDAAPGMYPGIETGWGSPITNLTYAAMTGQTGGVDHDNSPAGLAFARFLKNIGSPAPNAGAGPEFP